MDRKKLVKLVLACILLMLCALNPGSTFQTGPTLAEQANAAPAAGYTLSGKILLPNGQLYTKNLYLYTTRLTQTPSSGIPVVNGSFSVVLPPGIYLLSGQDRPIPYFLPVTKVDLRSGNVTNLVITLTEVIPEPIPIKPPDTNRMIVSPPDTEGKATLTGEPGAVEPLSQVLIVNLSANTTISTTSELDGSFNASLFAPAGSNLMVKYDREGWRVRTIWEKAWAYTPDDTYPEVNPLPGTILQTGAPPPGADGQQSFNVAGSTFNTSNEWGGWWVSGMIQAPDSSAPGLHAQPGDTVAVNGTVHIYSPALNCSGTPAYAPSAEIWLRYAFADDGRTYPWGIWFNAHLFTPTGLPIEHETWGQVQGYPAVNLTSLTCSGPHTLTGNLSSSLLIPPNMPAGTYLPSIRINPGTIPLSKQIPLLLVWNKPTHTPLPPLTVGEPDGPRIPWTLLADYPVNGVRGLQAREDQGLFSMPDRSLTPPHHVVIPRLDERTGEPLVYRLEPGSIWLSATDRRFPNAPIISLKFPSGEIWVDIHKPDGTVDTLGPALIRQSSARTPTLPGGSDISFGTGQIDDLFHLTTMREDFGYSFEQYGEHVIAMHGAIKDIYGNVYPLESTYDVIVARVLDIDPAQLPTTPFMVGDAFAAGLHVFPPVPADVVVDLVQMPYSDQSNAIVEKIEGKANRYGYFQPPLGTDIRMEAPGEFRVDISAWYEEPDGTFWMGTMTWGSVIEGPGAKIAAHGRRGMDYKSNVINDMPAWFMIDNLPASKIGIEIYYPYFSGDIHWGMEDHPPGDSIHTIITVEDLTPGGTIYNLMQANYPRSRGHFRWPPIDTSLTGLGLRLAIDEAPLFISTLSGADPAVTPAEIDQWGYWYGSSQRPDVRVREIQSTDNMGTAYWRFQDTYTYQIGEGAYGDLPGDLKWEFGGAVFRAPSQELREYAIYSSLWVLLPNNDPVGMRVTPPFQDATGASINGGPIMKIDGQDIDMLFLPKGIRPGDILEVGDVVSFSGHVGPPLDSKVTVTITSPSGVVRSRTWHANKIGWLYDPTFDFKPQEPGRWTVDVQVLHDRPYLPNGVIPLSHNIGTVLGTAGRYEFYVVPAGSPNLMIASPHNGIIRWTGGGIEPVKISGSAPNGTTRVYYTIHDKGVVMRQGSLTPQSGSYFTFNYDAEALNAIFPFVSLTAREGRWEGLADEVTINMLAVGAGLPRAASVTLIGEEAFVLRQSMPVYIPFVYQK